MHALIGSELGGQLALPALAFERESWRGFVLNGRSEISLHDPMHSFSAFMQARQLVITVLSDSI